MALDPSIILATRPVELPDPGKLMQLRNLATQGQAQDLQLQQQRKSIADSQALSDIYRGATGADGKIDYASVQRGMAGAGLGAQIPAYQKQRAELESALAEHGIKSLDEFKKRTDVVNGRLSSLLADPNLTHDKVINSIGGLVDSGVIDSQQGAKMVRDLPGPDQLRNYLIGKATETLEASKRLELMLPKYDEQNRGGTISQGTINPMTGQRTETGSIVKTISPDAAAQAAAMSANPAVTYQPDANGNLVAVPTRAGPGPIKAQPVQGPNGQPLPSKSNTTEDQAKATGWLAQATNAFDNMETAIKEDPSSMKPGTPEFVSSIPSMGIGEAVGNAMRSPTRQKYVQAASSLSEALLRAATGAGVNKEEAKQKIAEITPQWGDSDAVIAQKRAAVPVYLETLRTRAGTAGRTVAPAVGQAPPAPAATPSGASVSNW
jgi:hypothetical protein